MNLGKPVIKLAFMDDEMKDFAISESLKALDISLSERVIYLLFIININYLNVVN